MDQSLPLKIFLPFSLGGGGGRYFSAPRISIKSQHIRVLLFTTQNRNAFGTLSTWMDFSMFSTLWGDCLSLSLSLFLSSLSLSIPLIDSQLLRGPAAILFTSRHACSDSIAKLFRACSYRVSDTYRAIHCKLLRQAAPRRSR